MPSPSGRGRAGLKARAPRLTRGKNRVAALKRAGAAVFAARGYDTATMTEIAARARAPIGSLYQFFPTKESLAAAIYDDLLDTLSGMLDELRESAADRADSAAEWVGRLLRRLSEFLDLHPEFIGLLDRFVNKERRRTTRCLMQNQIIALLSQAVPPLRRRRAEVLAVILLQLMRVMASLTDDEDEEMHSAVLAELRRMLRLYLESAQAV